MRIRLFNVWLAIIVIGALLASMVFPIPIKGQSTLVWDRPEQVTRKEKPNRKPPAPRPPKKVEKVPLLTLQLRVLKRLEDGSQVEANPYAPFHTGDRVRMAFKTNQDGYLYIIHHSEGEDGTIIFPDSRINHGQNFVRKNEEFIVPAYCPTREFDDPRDCWWRMTPPAGREIFTVIFSRDLITSLPNKVTEAGGRVSLKVIEELKATSDQMSIKRTSRPNLNPQQGGGAGGYAIWITNTNPKDNEELIDTIVLTHGV
jgi:hypothetical protein